MRRLVCVVLVGLSGCTEAPNDVTPGETWASAPDVSATLNEAGQDGLDDSASEPLPPLVYAPCDVSERVGGFRVTLADAYTGVDGYVLDGVVPSTVPEEVQREGDCRLLRAVSLYCEPPCVPGETCGFDGACIGYPERRSVGLVTLTGLLDELVMEAKWGNTYTNPSSMTHPGYVPGAEIELDAEGGAFEPFRLGGVGVEPLSIAPELSVVVAIGQAIELTWLPPSVDGPVKVHIELNVNNHGATSAWIACDVEDSGAFTLSASLLDALHAIGVSGFPSLSMSRRSVDSTPISPGCVDFMVVSEQSVPVEIEGLTSCTTDAQCPPGQRCGAELACR